MGVTGESSNRSSELDLEVELVHAEVGSRVVLVRARRGGRVLEAALGEGTTVEEAEDRARQRLLSRLPDPPAEEAQAAGSPNPAITTAPSPSPPTIAPPTNAPQTIAPPISRPTPGSVAPPSPQLPSLPPDAAEPPADPEDWSTELARLDLQLQRLGWDRAQEGTYLERVFGHPSRNRLTSYGDLLAYLQALEGLAAGQDPTTAPAPLRRRELLRQCDQLLEQLQWDPGQGRSFLEQHFSLASRQQLSDTQLLQFNMLLEEEFIKTGRNPFSS
ncbi:MAG: hypothetical protein NTX18_03250 [Cyanobium sp. LacPavin_0818_WC50_MAG_67_9]|nr:hypothetical protein [Cyanobium sp. LacPavin_0818_WC50_MAG_67_9]